MTGVGAGSSSATVGAIADIEEALFAQWSHFGRWPRGELHDENGALWFETPISHLPYNGVIRARLGESTADATIATLMERFRSRAVDFFWVVHPSATPADLGYRLSRAGLAPVERMSGMFLDLRDCQPAPLPQGIRFEEVVDDAGIKTYSDLTARYWEIREDERELVVEFHRHWGPGRAPGHRYLAFVGDEPIGKAYLSLAGPPEVASIYGMFITPERRGRGVAGGLTTTLLQCARERGCRRAVLHATEMAIGVYRRAGFIERCELPVFATASLWSGDN